MLPDANVKDQYQEVTNLYIPLQPCHFFNQNVKVNKYNRQKYVHNH